MGRAMKGHGGGAGGDEHAVLELHCILWISMYASLKRAPDFQHRSLHTDTRFRPCPKYTIASSGLNLCNLNHISSYCYYKSKMGSKSKACIRS